VSLAEEKKWLDGTLAQIRKGREKYLAAECDGKIVASCAVEKSYMEDRQPHVASLGIMMLPEFRGEGLGTRMINAAEGQAKKMGVRLLWLSVFQGNERANRLYEKMGFRKYGVLPKAVKFKGREIGQVFMFKRV